MKSRLTCLLVATILSVTSTSFAQTHKWEVGLNLGASTYQGDLVVATSFLLKESNPAFGLFFRNYMHKSWTLRANFIHGKLTGDDWNYPDNYDRVKRAAQFSTKFSEIMFLIEYDFFGKKRYPKTGVFRQTFSPYIYTGFGGISFEPKANFERYEGAGLIDEIRADANAPIGATRLVVPLGAGLRFDVNEKISVSAEGGFRAPFTDYLDGISKTGNEDKSDLYIIGNLSIAYRFFANDTDGDGIANSKDLCPAQPGVASLNGCPDADGDGIADSRDQCPDIAGVPSLVGCPDGDKDGIADAQDKCPTEFGLKDREGCPLRDKDGDGTEDDKDECPELSGPKERLGCPLPDSDGDGVPDDDDKCPTSVGSPKYEGCPDTDNDGVLDAADECPEVPGFSKFAGCPDTDRDGLPDKDDDCPELAGSPDNYGCPDTSLTLRAFEAFEYHSVLFEVNSSEIRPEYKEVLDRIARFMAQNLNYDVRIFGFTDVSGNALYNQWLSEKRARNCMNYLSSRGLNPNRMKFRGYGEGKPQEKNDDVKGRQLNRRVEFQIYRAVHPVSDTGN